MPTDDPSEPQTRSPSIPSADPYATVSPAEGSSAPLTHSGGFGVDYLAFDDRQER